MIIEDKFNVSNNDPDFIYWLAGLIDGDGSLLVNKNKALTSLSCTVISHVKALFKIKEKYHGSVLNRSNVKALDEEYQKNELFINYILILMVNLLHMVK